MNYLSDLDILSFLILTMVAGIVLFILSFFVIAGVGLAMKILDKFD